MTMKPKKIPLRMCSGCSGRFSKKELVRVVRSPDGEISLDTTGRKSGRGAYVCPKAGCLKLARKAKRLERALECAIPDAVYDSLEKAMVSEEAQQPPKVATALKKTGGNNEG